MKQKEEDILKQEGIIYQISFLCGLSYVGATSHILEKKESLNTRLEKKKPFQ